MIRDIVWYSLLGAADVLPRGQESYVHAMFRLGGPGICGLTLAAGLAVLIGAVYIVAKCQRPAIIASYLVWLPLPLLIAVLLSLERQIESFITLSALPAQPGIDSASIAAGVAAGVVPVFMAILATVPSYFVIAFGLLVRALKS